MPRDKTESHIKVNIAIREEFMEKGFEGASIRSIGARAGMTSAGLYRQYPYYPDIGIVQNDFSQRNVCHESLPHFFRSFACLRAAPTKPINKGCGLLGRLLNSG